MLENLCIIMQPSAHGPLPTHNSDQAMDAEVATSSVMNDMLDAEASLDTLFLTGSLSLTGPLSLTHPLSLPRCHAGHRVVEKRKETQDIIFQAPAMRASKPKP